MYPAKPDPERVFRAIDIYMQLAYGDTSPPVRVRSLLAMLHSSGNELYDAPFFASDLHDPPTRYSVRLGNRYYPHMKLELQLTPDDEMFVFCADSHDRHCCPASSSPEYPAFVELMRKNQDLAQSIESAWEADGLPTFKAYLRADLARRVGARQAT